MAQQTCPLSRRIHATEVAPIPFKNVLRSARQRVLLSIVAEHGHPISTTDLARITGETLGATAHHVRALARAGLLQWAGERRARGALQTFYVVSEAGREALREPRVDALLTLFGAFVSPHGGRLAQVQDLDEQACDDLQRIIERLRPEMTEIITDALRRTNGATPRSRPPRG